MANLLIKIEKEDVTTSRVGLNIMVQCRDNISIVFDFEAIEELIGDYNKILLMEKESKKNLNEKDS
jgi:hypothetical protein